ncbi:MAG: inositol monophosphatase family protein, partial [Gemmatimonadota bacterium]
MVSSIMTAEPVAISPDALVRLTGIAREAGTAAMEHYHAGVSVTQKGDRGPVTAADHAAHDVIVRALSEWDASIPVISEEGDIPAHPVRAGWRRFWLVDP